MNSGADPDTSMSMFFRLAVELDAIRSTSAVTPTAPLLRRLGTMAVETFFEARPEQPGFAASPTLATAIRELPEDARRTLIDNIEANPSAQSSRRLRAPLTRIEQAITAWMGVEIPHGAVRFR